MPVATTGPCLDVAGPAHLARLLTGAPCEATVVLTGRSAAYLRVETGTVLAVVTPSAVALPSALLLPGHPDPRDLLPAGTTALVGAGRVAAQGVTLTLSRWWSVPALPRGRPDAAAVAVLGRLLTASSPPEPSSDILRARAAAGPAATALAAGDAVAAARALVGVLGLGPGSTPAGDDVAAGVLLAARAVGTPAAVLDPVATHVSAAAVTATGVVSAALLADAARGRCAAAVSGAVAALLGRRPAAPALSRLLALGHTSGTDLATGLLAVARTDRPAPEAGPMEDRQMEPIP